MNLYLISQTENEGYDTYDSAVVCAETEEQAQMIHPGHLIHPDVVWDGKAVQWGTWCDAEQVKVQLVGSAVPGTKLGTVICSSFNAQ